MVKTFNRIRYMIYYVKINWVRQLIFLGAGSMSRKLVMRKGEGYPVDGPQKRRFNFR